MDTVFAAGKYVDWGVISISVTNLAVILVMIVVFVLAILLPFPQGQVSPPDQAPGSSAADQRPAS